MYSKALSVSPQNSIAKHCWQLVSLCSKLLLVASQSKVKTNHCLSIAKYCQQLQYVQQNTASSYTVFIAKHCQQLHRIYSKILSVVLQYIQQNTASSSIVCIAKHCQQLHSIVIVVKHYQQFVELWRIFQGTKITAIFAAYYMLLTN